MSNESEVSVGAEDGITTEGESDRDIQAWLESDDSEPRVTGDEPEEEIQDDDEPEPEPEPVKRKARPPETEEDEEAQDPKPKPKAKQAYDPEARVTVKVDGEDVEITLDQAVREYRRRAAADRRFQEAAELRRQAEAKLEALKKDPWEMMKDLGIDPDDAASKRILAKIEEEKLAAENPAELKRRQAEKELEATRAELEAQKKAAEEVQIEQKRAEIRAKIDKQFSSALTDAQLPRTPYTVARMADVLQRNIREDPRFDATPKELAQLVREDLQMELVTVARALGPDQLEKFLGADAIKALRKHDLERARHPSLASRPRTVGDEDPKPRRRRADYTDPDEADKALEEWAQG